MNMEGALATAIEPVAAAPEPAPVLAQVGIVAIGRNEGDRLHRCFASLPPGTAGIVYVDSGSSDDSVAQARARAIDVVELDMTVPFTAARARNAGISRLREIAPKLRFVQVLDGDCELVPGFVEEALAVMSADPKVAVVCGRRRELQRDASVYNRITDMEWDTPVGETEACGGDALIRLEAFDAIGGYDDGLIAGEEPEMCLRMRRAGFRIHRIACDMTRHDAAMSRFAQWWRRSVRAGYAAAEGAHGQIADGFNRRITRSNVLWGFALPGLAFAMTLATAGASLLLLCLYAVLFCRVRSYRVREQGDRGPDATAFALYCVLGKLPQFLGALRFELNRLRGRRATVIEYKRA